MSYLSTQELESYIYSIYEKLKPIAEKDDVYQPLTIHFATGTPHNQPGDYCYSDEDGYHYCNIGDFGETYPEEVTKSLFEISYLIIKHPIMLMCIKYRSKNSIEGQDFRRISFKKQLQYFEALGNEYKQKAELEINAILEKRPFEDCGIMAQNARQKEANKPMYKLETNGYYYEDGLFSIELMKDILRHFSPNEWDFMTLSSNIPIKGSSFIQVGSPDAKTDHKMTVEIGFPKSSGVELFRYYTDDKDEVLQIFKNYYLKQEIPNYKKWHNVSKELKRHRPRRFL